MSNCECFYFNLINSHGFGIWFFFSFEWFSFWDKQFRNGITIYCKYVHCWKQNQHINLRFGDKNGKGACYLKMNLYALQCLIRRFGDMPTRLKTKAICYLLCGATVKILPNKKEKERREENRHTHKTWS